MNRSTGPKPQRSRKRSRTTTPKDATATAAAGDKNTSNVVEQECEDPLAMDYYGRLRHQCHKAWNKHVKAIQKVEQLKYSKKVQVASAVTLLSSTTGPVMNQALEKNTANRHGNSNTVHVQKWTSLKALSVQDIVQEAMRRLGLESLNPNRTKKEINTSPHDDDHDDDDDNRHDATERSPQHNDDNNNSNNDKNKNHNKANDNDDDDDYSRWWIETILSHKRLVQLAEEWNAEITKYRIWYRERQRRRSLQVSRSAKTKNKTKKKSHSTVAPPPTPHDAATADSDFITHGQSLFYQLGSSGSEEEDENDDDDDDMGDSLDKHNGPRSSKKQTTKKRNRPGQRARRASHEANNHNGISHGKALHVSHDENPNTKRKRPRSRGPEDPNEGVGVGGDRRRQPLREEPNSKRIRMDADAKSNKNNSTTATTSTTTNQEELHPSWAARKTQTNGIVPFQGTKITFDDDNQEE
ncbi:hypothetical protein ACA910_002484 [Epithemia clementina (nom. ined.)]